MRFKVDENLPEESAELLTRAGHDAVTVISQGMGGGPDANLATVCRSENRALVTLDLDFANVRAYPPTEYPGIVVFRPASQARSRVLRLVRLVCESVAREGLAGKLWIVDETGIRIREGD